MATHRVGGLWTAMWAGLLVLLSVFSPASPCLAYDNPDLLPDHPTPVIDLARAFSDNQRAGLEQSLDQFEANTGWKLRVLTQYERTPGLAIREFWGLDERSLLLVSGRERLASGEGESNFTGCRLFVWPHERQEII